MSDRLSISKNNQEEAARWQRLKNSKIWDKLCVYLRGVISNSDIIINSLGADSEKEFTKRDVAIIKKQNAEYLLNLPQTLIDNLTGTGTLETEEMDAYKSIYDESTHSQKEIDDDIY